MDSDIFDKSLGCFRGLAIGDALGAPVEFKGYNTFEPVSFYQPTIHFGLEPGQWTDDTSMSLCLSKSLIKDHGYNSYTVMDNYVDWFQNGHLSSTGQCFDIGAHTREALNDYMSNSELYLSDITDSAGNGTIMRLAPAAIVSTSLNVEESNDLFVVSAIDTHYNYVASETTAFFGLLLRFLILGYSVDEAFTLSVDSVFQDSSGLQEKLLNVHEKNISTSGYVVDSLCTAWWAFTTTNNFYDAVIKAVNRGGDADTIGAITGQLAGAYYGDSGIDEELVNGLFKHDIFPPLTKALLKVDSGVLETRLRYEIGADN